jgi:flagellar assembly protein FliH
MDFPELTTPQERYDRGFQRGYLAGYAEGARQAQAERAAELASHKAAWAATQARASSLVSQLSSAANEYLARWGGRDLALTEELMAAAFSVAESVVGCELRARPDRALEVARAALASLPPGPVIVRVHPEDEEFMRDATGLRSGQKGTEVLTDASVGRGGCVISCGGTTVDARVAEALARAKAAFCGAEEDQR